MVNIKHEWRKQEKEYYIAKEVPKLIKAPKMKFVMLEGYGNPNNEDFSDSIGVLYSVAYGIKILPKKGITPEGYFEYTVYPLEGIWEATDVGDKFNKDKLHYKIMIRQPEFVKEALFKDVIEIVKKKKPHQKLDKVEFIVIDESQAVQCLHKGSYDNEPETFSKMDKFCSDNNLKRTSGWHREIYLNDATKVETDKLMTVLQYDVVAKG